MSTVKVKDYASAIELTSPFKPSLLGFDIDEAVEILWQELEPVLRALGAPGLYDCDGSQKRQWLDAAITVLEPNALTSNGEAVLDTILDQERKQRSVTPLNELISKPFMTIGDTKIVLWKGDITTLAIDAIVNAANHQMQGCFQPGHRCIDNAIHNRAGVQLRSDCKTIMDIQGHDELAGQAKLTRGYHLPARYVIHTVGPVVAGMVQASHRKTLADSYRSVLDITTQVPGIDSIALCSISTGVYGYPIEEATPVAIKEVVNWVKHHPNELKSVVFNVFSDRDYSVYQSLLEEFVCQS